MISVKLAKEISLLKWEGELNGIRNSVEIRELYLEAFKHFNCGFCIRHNYSSNNDSNNCLNCEIASTSAGMCSDDDSLYDRIEAAIMLESPNKNDLIKELIEIIKNIPEEDE